MQRDGFELALELTVCHSRVTANFYEENLEEKLSVALRSVGGGKICCLPSELQTPIRFRETSVISEWTKEEKSFLSALFIEFKLTLPLSVSRLGTITALQSLSVTLF